MKASNLILTHEDSSLIIQALLFAASADVCADWNDNDNEKMLVVAKHVMSQFYSNDEKPDLEKICLYGEIPYEQDLSEALPKDFGLKVKTT